MSYRLTGAGAFGFNLAWEKVPGDEVPARAAITYLEDRRVLYGRRDVEDGMFAVQSALAAREFLTELLREPRPQKSLALSLKAMRVAFRRFVDAAGPHGRNFMDHYQYGGLGPDPFSLALGELRGTVGMHVAAIASQYDIEVEDELASILPLPVEEADELEG